MFNYLNELNPQQREAVLHLDGPLMIIAGAGSGKTKVLTTRIAHLMANGVTGLFPCGEGAGYAGGMQGPQPEEAVTLLRLLYAGVPCLLKLAAIVMLWRTKLNRSE